ncbi:MAG TPA: polyribonucleotide nucleotidyltransferase [Firmicutes bacterium]|nr:polyribonucleotide nucleotidyltransferase [Bacillota bacterium]
MKHEFHLELGGRTLTIETGALAKQANGSVLMRYGDTVVLVTATMAKEPREGIDFFPLLVDYEERMYAVGKVPGGWGRREGRPGEAAILAARMIDRPLRPLFPEGMRNDVQIVATILSVDQDNAPDITALIGASAALSISDIPFNGPVGGVVVGRVDGQFVINPTFEQQQKSDLHLVVAGTKDAVNMVEAGAHEVPEDVVLEAIKFGHQHIVNLVEFQEEIVKQIGLPKKELQPLEIDPEVEQWVREKGTSRLDQALRNPDKLSREADVDNVRLTLHEEFVQEFGEEIFAEKQQSLDYVISTLIKELVRHMIIHEKRRPDGRALDEIRPITCEVGLLPRAHGSAVFTRGQTQVLTSCTLGVKSDEQLLDDLGYEESKRYIHHYNFPSFSVGEVRPIRGPGRREIGHGALAERALLPMIPGEDEFPYTIRLVSEVLESNGSSSMASVCGSTLALMDAGVPITRPVAGIAMGLVKDGDNFSILSDIQGMEDALGDMDFKVAGTERGITALQMDIKIQGVIWDVLQQALAQAREGRLYILSKMLEVIDRPRPQLSPYAPRILTMEIPVDKIRDVIGPGGKTIRKIIDETGVTIDIEDDGRVYVASTNQEAGYRAQKMIELLVKDVQVGETYMGTVKRIADFGAFVELLPGKEGLLHISKLAASRVNKVEDVVQVGDTIPVKVVEIDHMGRINLARPEVLEVSQNKKSRNGRGKRPRS